MKPAFSIALLTIREGIRMGIVLIFVVLLAAILVAAPFVLSGDGTLSGRLQNVLNWSLAALSVCLSVATVFFSCSTLATEIRERSIHLVVTKPVSRFQVLLGKWLGINLLNLLLVTLCGLTIYGFAVVIRNQPALNPRDRINIENVVWTARVAVPPVEPEDIRSRAEALVDQKIKEGVLAKAVRRQAVGERMTELFGLWRTIAPQDARVFEFKDLQPVEDDGIIQVRFKARGRPEPLNYTLHIYWNFLDSAGVLMMDDWLHTEERSGDTHQFLVRPRIIQDGQARIAVMNPPDLAGRTSIQFESRKADGSDGEVLQLELLYPESTFEINLLKTLLLILCQLSFLSAVGLLFGTFVSFPIACLCVCFTYVIGLGHSWWWESIGADMPIRTDDIDPYGKFGPVVRIVLQPVLAMFPDFGRFSGAAMLVQGEYIPWMLIGESALHTVGFGAALLLLVGWLVFQRREIAEVTV